MSLKYDVTTRLKDLEPVLDQYTEWYLLLTRRIFFHDKIEGTGFKRPSSFMAWLEKSRRESFLDPEVLAGLENLHNDLMNQAEGLFTQAASASKTPTYDDYDKLATFFEEFLYRARRLERDCLLEDSGIDVLTGLRSRDVMENDISREMDRLARQGKPFSLAMVKIDHYDEDRLHLSPEASQDLVIKVADLIKRSVRSFDDAYRLNNGVFLLSLKQTTSTGGVRALQRLKEAADAKSHRYTAGPSHRILSLSSCIAEPIPDLNVQDLIANMRKDLTEAQDDHGAIVEYHEITPLQRYIREDS